MKNKLSILEKILIRCQSAEDRNNNGFYEYLPEGSEKPIILSDFIANELVQFSLDVRHLFNRRWCIVTLHSEKCTHYRRVMRRSDALDLIDIQIAQQEASIREIALRSAFDIQLLKVNKEKSHQTKSFHWEEMYKRQLAEKENQLKDEVSEHYLSIKDLLSEKQRLLKKAFRSYEILRGKQILRIQYCCGVSGMSKMKHQAVPLKMTDYDSVIDNTIPAHFQAELNKTQEKLNNVANELQTS